MAKYKYNGVTYDYAGTKITGTSTSEKKFESSGIASAKKNDTYLNTAKGHVYICTEGGDAKKAKWKYKKTIGVEKPVLGVRSLKLKRGDSNRTMTASWKLPSDFAKATSGKKAEHIVVTWVLDTSKKGKKNIVDKETRKAVATSDSENLDKLKIDSGKNAGKEYARTDFYPYSGKPNLLSVTVRVTPTNSKGTPNATAKEADKKTLISQVKTYAFEKPKKPKVTDWAFDTETGIVSGKITVDEGDGKNECLWTDWTMTVTDTSKAKASQVSTPSYATGDTRKSIPFSYNVSNYQSLTETQYVHINITATAKGYAGDSDTLSSDYYVSFPKPVKISKVKATSKDSSGKVTASVTVTSTTEFPVDRVKLQRLVDVPYATASEIPGNAGWEDSGAVDDSKCTALVCGVTDVMPSRGNHTWLRVKAWHANEDALFSYSNVVEVTDLYEAAPSAADNKCTIVDVSPTEDGGADVVVAWDLASSATDDDTTSMELAWSEDADAWRSTTGPDSYEFEWKDDTKDARADGWKNTATVKVTELTDGLLYYFRARCLADIDGVVSRGAWCNPAQLLVSSIQPSAALSADATSPTGKGVTFSWAFSSSAAQTSWQLVSSSSGSEKTVMAGDGPDTSCVAPWERVAECMGDGEITCVIRCTSGGEPVESNPVSVRIAEPPAITVAAPTLTAQPMTFTVTSSKRLSLLAYAIADGDGNPVDAGAVVPEMSGAGAVWSGAVTLAGNRGFADGLDYTLAAVATCVDGLESEQSTSEFAVDWSHKAPAPPDELEITPELLELDDRTTARRCTVALVPPDGALGTEVYDVYRITHDGLDLVSPDKGFPLEYTFVDDFAPYGDAGDYGYRVACRTVDGDTAFRDYDYYLEGDVLRFDFAASYVELPYNIGISDSYEKDAETRMHLSGDTEAYFNPGVTRKASLSSDIIRIDDADKAAAVRALGRHAGTAFVRTPDGSAYEAHVDVSAMDVSPGIVAVSIDAHEVATSDAFKLPLPLESESVEQEYEPDTPVEPEE